MTAHPSELAGVVALLRRARTRKHTTLVLEAAAWAGVAGLLACAVLGGVRFLQPQLWLGWFGSNGDSFLSSAAGVAICVVALVLAILLPLAERRTPKLLGLAKSADIAFGLQERLSTALEIAPKADGERWSAVQVALSLDAASQAPLIDPKSLVPFRIPNVVWALPVLLLGAVLLWSWPQPQMTAPNGSAVAAIEHGHEVLSAQERQETAQEIERIADLVERKAEERSDPFMRAMARTLDALGDEIASDLSLDRGEVLSELAQMADYVAQGDESWSGQTDAELAGLMEASARQIDPSMTPTGQTEGESRSPASQTAPRRDESLDGRSATAEPVPLTAPEAQQTPEQGDEGTTNGAVKDLMEQLSKSDQGPESGPSGEGTPTTASADHYSMVQRDAQRQTQRADAIGDFEQSQDGNFTDPMANPWGGESSRSADNDVGVDDGSGMADVEFGVGAELMLEARDAGGGRRIRKDTPPTAQFSNVQDRASAAGNAAWSRLEEWEVSRTYLGPELRDTVSAYFMGRNMQVSE